MGGGLGGGGMRGNGGQWGQVQAARYTTPLGHQKCIDPRYARLHPCAFMQRAPIRPHDCRNSVPNSVVWSSAQSSAVLHRRGLAGRTRTPCTCLERRCSCSCTGRRSNPRMSAKRATAMVRHEPGPSLLRRPSAVGSQREVTRSVRPQTLPIIPSTCIRILTGKCPVPHEVEARLRHIGRSWQTHLCPFVRGSES